MLEGGVNGENRNVLSARVGILDIYRKTRNLFRSKLYKGTGRFINADHQPPVSCILNAYKLNPNSRLAKAFLEVGTNSSQLDPNQILAVKKNHGLELLTVCVPKEVHNEFPSTKSQAFRDLLAEAISKDNVVDTFKLMISGSMPRFRLNSTKNFNNFQSNPMSKIRLDVFEKSFKAHSQKIVNTWFRQLEVKGVMNHQDHKIITDWINKQGCKQQNDLLTQRVAGLI